jgi:hypothetical protein
MCRQFSIVSRETRSIWLSCLQTLDYDCAPDLPPHIAANIHSMSTQEIREIAIRAVRGFYNWTSPRLSYAGGRPTPVPTREHHLHLIPSWSSGRPSAAHLAEFRAHLAAGGEYVIVNNHGTLEVVTVHGDAIFKSPGHPRSGSEPSSMESQRQRWRDHGHATADDILGFGNDMVDEGKTIVIAAVTLRYSNTRLPRRLCVSWHSKGSKELD